MMSCKASASVLTGMPGFLVGSRWRLAQQNHKASQSPLKNCGCVAFSPQHVVGHSVWKANETSTDVPVVGPRGAEESVGAEGNGPKILKVFSRSRLLLMSLTELNYCKVQYWH